MQKHLHGLFIYIIFTLINNVEILKNKVMEKIKTFVISVGQINIPTGNTSAFGNDDWSIYESPNSCIYLTDRSSLLFASENTFNDGDEIQMIYNDNNRKVSCGEQKIVGHCKCVAGEVIDFLFSKGYDYKPKRAFQKSKFSRKLSTSFSVKGTTI